MKAPHFPQVCSPISRNVDICRYPHLQGLRLADSFAESSKMEDLVLGIDYYHAVVQDEVCKGSTLKFTNAVKSRCCEKQAWLASFRTCK